MTKKKDESSEEPTVKVRLLRPTRGAKVGDVREVSGTEADRLEREHHAVKVK